MGRLFGWEGERERKVVGSDYFLSELTKIQSSQNGRKLERKGGTCVLDKITLPYLSIDFSFCFLLFFHFFLFAQYVHISFVFCFLCFFFFFFGAHLKFFFFLFFSFFGILLEFFLFYK